MFWIDALIEMKKDNTKVFDLTGQMIRVKMIDGKLHRIFFDKTTRVCAICTDDYGVDWVEVNPWKEVNYADFMVWYCNKDNIGKGYQIQYQETQGYQTSRNLHGLSPDYILSKLTNTFQIPNE